jgi:hypothetical protein
MAPSALPPIDEIKNKRNPRQAYVADVNRTIEDISSNLREAIKHVFLSPSNDNATSSSYNLDL